MRRPPGINRNHPFGERHPAATHQPKPFDPDADRERGGWNPATTSQDGHHMSKDDGCQRDEGRRR